MITNFIIELYSYFYIEQYTFDVSQDLFENHGNLIDFQPVSQSTPTMTEENEFLSSGTLLYQFISYLSNNKNNWTFEWNKGNI